MPVTLTCPTCARSFTVKPSHASKAKYCSRACMAKGYREQLKGAANPNYRAAFERQRCEYCAQSIASFNKRRRFCSRRCHQLSGVARANAMRNGRLSGGGNLDRNHHAIVDALRKVGASVASLASLGNGCPDIVVGFRGRNFVIEIKNPDTAYGKKGLNEMQQQWADTWRGSKVIVVRTPLEALQAIGAVRRTG